jgi:putative chitinase
MLKKGSEGPKVKVLQEKLGVEAIGKFGPKTEMAVKEYQEKLGLEATGVVDSELWERLFPPPKYEKYQTQSTSNMNIHLLKGHIPDAVISQLPDTIAKFELNTPLRLAHFLAQAGHESGGFKVLNENLNYSAKGLLGIFKKYFPTEAKANQYQRKPEKIANLVYGGRMGNGPEASGEGYKFRGRGYIQLTGKDNYKAFRNVTQDDVVAYPDLVSTKYPLYSAAWFFHKNGLHKIADEGASDAVVTKVTKRVNGGTIGLSDRIKHFKEYYKLLS